MIEIYLWLCNVVFINLLDVYGDAAFYVLGIWAVEE